METSERNDTVPTTVVDQIDLLEELSQLLDAREELVARIVDLAGRARRCPDLLRIEGMPLDLVLAKAHNLTGAERWMLLTASRVLADMPTTRAWFRARRLSWSQVRAIVSKARRLGADDRAALDERIAATGDRLDAFDPDQLLEAVDRVVDELKGRRAVERAERREQRANFLQVQPRLFGGIQLYGEYDPVSGATIVNALDAASDTPAANRGADGEPTTRSRQRAAGLVELSRTFLGGATASGEPRRAKPQLIVHVPLEDVTTTAAGQVELNLAGAGLPTVTARTLEALNTDADLRAVIFDGARPLAVSDKVCASRIPTKTRIAVRARDRGDRWPASRAPIGHCDIDHYLEPQRDGGGHDPDGLIALSREPHRIRGHHGWEVTVAHDTGIVTFTRGHRTWRSIPWGTPLSRPSPPRGDDWPSAGRDPPSPS